MSSVLALHGFTGAPESFAELAALVPTVTFLCPALAGHGPEPDTTSHDFAAEVERLATWLRTRSSERVVVLGYSLGARVALGLCGAHPELFSAAVLVGVNPGLGTEAERRERIAWETRLIDLLESEGLTAFLTEWERLPLFASQSALSPERRSAQRRIRESHHATGLAHSLRALGTGHMPDLAPQLGSIPFPVTLVVGEQDAKFRALAERTLPALREAHLAVVPGAGHNPLVEAPEALAAELTRALAPRSHVLP
jgi:2-succinyl-6-hydroxy-2,4-cyclohexadiene-1-carboxylate synthase